MPERQRGREVIWHQSRFAAARERGQQQSPSVELFLETENIQLHTIIFNNIQLYTDRRTGLGVF